jgi:hypothetical protein
VNHKQIESWYEEHGRKAGETSEQIARTPFRQKMIAFSLIMSVPIALSGCSSEPQQFTAEEECEWEMEKNGWELDCDDENSSWYKKKGYKSKHSIVPATSPIYKGNKGTGSGGKRGGFFSGG